MGYTVHQQELLDKVKNRMKENNLSQAEAAAQIGMSKAALSQLLSGTYKANPQKMFDSIESYFNVKERTQQTYKEVSYADTHISTEVYDVIGVCHAKGGLAIAAGDAGIGKTKAAQHLTLKTIEVLRSFSDYFNDRGQTLGICFIGNMDTVAHIGSKKAEFAQIANRTKQTKVYTREKIQRSDIVKLFPILQENDMEREIEYLLRIAKTPQALRGAINLFSNAYDNENYSYAGLVAMAKFMDMERRSSI